MDVDVPPEMSPVKTTAQTAITSRPTLVFMMLDDLSVEFRLVPLQLTTDGSTSHH